MTDVLAVSSVASSTRLSASGRVSPRKGVTRAIESDLTVTRLVLARCNGRPSRARGAIVALDLCMAAPARVAERPA